MGPPWRSSGFSYPGLDQRLQLGHPQFSQPRATPSLRLHHYRYYSQPQPPKWPPPNPIFLAAIKDALAWHPPPRSKPVLKFKLTELAARTNLESLESCNYDLQAILLEDAHSPRCPGSKFCPTAISAKTLLTLLVTGSPKTDRSTITRSLLVPVSC
jgi:hypothetical protein